MHRVKAVYLVETALDVESAVSALAGEQSSGTFVKVPGETEELLERFAARVEQVQLLERVAEPSLPGHRVKEGPFQRAQVVVSWPVHNFGANLPTLVSTLQGNLYELAQFSGLKLCDIQVPESFAENFEGPRFGITGTRELTGVQDRPLIGTIIKPSVGLSPLDTAKRVRELAKAGIDFIKDDELMASPPHSPFDERVDAVMRAIDEHADRTGKKVMYAFNISDEIDAALRHYDKIIAWPGAPLCRAVSRGLANNIEFNFKGGQVGDESYFETVRRGKP